MKKLLFILTMLVFFSSCGGPSNSGSKSSNTDSAGLANPTAIDTIKHPSGVDNSSVISTDTAAMNVQNSLKKADSVAKQKNK